MSRAAEYTLRWKNALALSPGTYAFVARESDDDIGASFDLELVDPSLGSLE